MLRFLLIASLAMAFASLSSAQIDAARVDGNLDNTSPPDSQVTTFTGKLKIEASSAPIRDAVVVLTCGERVRAQTSADSNGNFSLTVSQSEDMNRDGFSSSGLAVHRLPADNSSGDWIGCDIHATAPGYASERQQLTSEPSLGIVQLGTILLQPWSSAPTRQSLDDFNVNIASLQVPKDARKAFTEGTKQAKRGKWAVACDYFKKAVEAYPRYVLAWVELGRAQLHTNSVTEAQQSFQQAATHDNNFVPAYVELARVAAERKEWTELGYATDNLVRISPNSSAFFWFLNSVAKFNTGNIQQAQLSIDRALRLDANHAIPQIEYLYGMILARTGKYSEGIQHIQTFLQLAPQSSVAASARNDLARIQQLMQTAAR